MKINSNYRIREIAGENIVVSQGRNAEDTTRIISLNSSARMLYESLIGKDFSTEEAANLLIEKYGIDRTQALEDANEWAETLRKCHIIE